MPPLRGSRMALGLRRHHEPGDDDMIPKEKVARRTPGLLWLAGEVSNLSQVRRIMGTRRIRA